MRNKELRDAVTALRLLLEAVERGEITADTPTERRMMRQVEGALAALEAATEPTSKDRDLGTPTK